MIEQKTIILPPHKRGYHLITRKIEENLPKLPEKGLLNLHLMHTSAAITLNENADPTVRLDFESFFKRLVPEGASYFAHTLEGDDDMPAHIKASILGQNLSIPFSNGRMSLGIWQGIYLCEFRNRAEKRNILVTIIS